MMLQIRELAVSLMLIASSWGAVDAQTPTGTSLNDSWITTKIAASFFMDADIKSRSIEVQTVNGVVTLTGTVRSAPERDQAVSIARTVDGVKQVVDKLTIGPDAAAVGTSGTMAQAEAKVGDAWITTKVQAKFFADSVVKGRNIGVSTDKGVVTLSGAVASEGERQQAVSLARNTEGVAQVVDQLKVQAQPTDAGGTAPRTSPNLPGSDELSHLMETDPMILGQIKSRFALDSQVSVLAIGVDVDHGNVTLKGEVKDQAARERAVAIAREVKGVKAVKDELRISGRE